MNGRTGRWQNVCPCEPEERRWAWPELGTESGRPVANWAASVGRCSGQSTGPSSMTTSSLEHPSEMFWNL
jgi:hypothetical protein